MLARSPKAIILSGGPASVYADGRAAHRPGAVRRRACPVFGICYGFQAMTQALGGEVAHTGGSEFGRTRAARSPSPACCCAGCRAEQQVWMSHGDAVTAPPDGLHRHRLDRPARRSRRSRTSAAGWPACSSTPRCMHTAHGQEMLRHFLYDIAGCRPTWTEANIIDEQVDGDPGAGRRQAGRSAGCPAASTRPSRPRSCSARSATSSPASSSTTACCARARPSRSSATSSPPPA